MRREDLPLEFRITVAQQALPFAHRKPKPQTAGQNRNGGSQSNVNEKIGPRVEIGKVDADDAEDADAHVMPLEFLLGVMRDPNTPPHLRLRAAGIVAPFVHSKGEPPPADGTLGEMRVIADSY